MLFTDVQRSVRLNKKKKSTNTSPYPDEVIDRLARAFYPATLACWNSEEGQREFAAWQAEQAHLSDHMQDSTNKALSRLPIRLLVATYEDSSKAKALLLAISTIEEDGKAKGLGNRQLAFMYDIAVVMDADNVTVPGFLSEVNRAYSAGVQAMQAHRTGKNLNTDIALLDGVSEEINNGFFRSGHNALGLSAGLAGSGMAFDYFWYYDAVQSLETAGEDKELELTLLECGMHTVYLEHLPVYDEKTHK